VEEATEGLAALPHLAAFWGGRHVEIPEQLAMSSKLHLSTQVSNRETPNPSVTRQPPVIVQQVTGGGRRVTERKPAKPLVAKRKSH